MEVSTTEPGFQLYCGGFLDGSNIGRGGKGYPKFGGFCVETQHYPDAINQVRVSRCAEGGGCATWVLARSACGLASLRLGRGNRDVRAELDASCRLPVVHAVQTHAAQLFADHAAPGRRIHVQDGLQIRRDVQAPPRRLDQSCLCIAWTHSALGHDVLACCIRLANVGAFWQKKRALCSACCRVSKIIDSSPVRKVGWKQKFDEPACSSKEGVQAAAGLDRAAVLRCCGRRGVLRLGPGHPSGHPSGHHSGQTSGLAYTEAGAGAGEKSK